MNEPVVDPQQPQGPDPIGDDLLGNYANCPDAPAAPPPVQINPATLAEQFWQTIPLPVPAPSIPPGYAITGKTAYLVTGGTVHPPAYTEPTPLGTLAITATGTYTVDWGDGTTTGPYSADSSGYPSGTITHTYDTTGAPTVGLAEDWTATWALGAAHGTLGGLHTNAAIPAFPVRQLQAVVSQ